eukprot:12110184-Heterocapsa_arctica.AAC.1
MEELPLAALEPCILPPRCNAAFEPVGSGTCGAFVLLWMEQAVRVYCREETPCSMGWPCNNIWAERLEKCCKTLLTLQKKLKDEDTTAVENHAANNNVAAAKAAAHAKTDA